jgi:hypothetical protein
MDEKQIQILRLLQKGYTYTQIQEALRVSPKVISAVKKAHFPSGKCSNDNTSGTSVQDFPDTSVTIDDKDAPALPEPPQYITNPTHEPKKPKTMSYNHDNYDDEDDDILASKLEVEKIKIQLAHDLEMEKHRIQSEEKERELDLKERELELKNQQIAQTDRLKEEEKANLLFKVKTFTGKCTDSELSLEEAEEMLAEAKALQIECERYCFVNNINFQGRDTHMLLSAIIKDLNEFIDEFDEEEWDTMDIEFDPVIPKTLVRMKFNNF